MVHDPKDLDLNYSRCCQNPVLIKSVASFDVFVHILHYSLHDVGILFLLVFPVLLKCQQQIYICTVFTILHYLPAHTILVLNTSTTHVEYFTLYTH